MGFTLHEKHFLQSLILPDEHITQIRDESLPPYILNFLKTEDHIRRTKDYAIFPIKHFHKRHKSENIIICKFVSPNFSLYKFVEKILMEISPPFNILIDYSMVVEHQTKNELRYVWPQRYTAMPAHTKMYDENDMHKLLSYLKPLSQKDIQDTVYRAHAYQSAFDESGFDGSTLLTCVVFLSKVSNLRTPIPLM